ncbi:YceI family protein [Flavobacterium aquicola]|uniref:YceI-like domain-containing protein n=1 Tax=Flavobacterium aquicola TaxID=1682742 RepID=A0A3E0E797_9FLAO|nr:YceI family protein [Flavobacterium aquicola]REG94111.1 YceI-like domain-containing protein [Flavobacterium aquicola]
MKNFTLLVLLFVLYPINAQNKFSTSKCVIFFEASVPLFEAVEAKNNDVNCTLLPNKSEITFTAVIKKFKFKRDLMQEHFNTNYMESDRYSKATFKGIIEKFDLKLITEEEKDFFIKGKITIHGESRMITVLAKIKKAGNGILINSNFTLNTDDFNIEIPNIVIAKISKKVNTQIVCVLN